MSLDFTLYDLGQEVFSSNITHNLGKMATAAGIYEVLWRPDENGYMTAQSCIEPLLKGLTWLILNPEEASKYNSPNGWGLYAHFVPFVMEVLQACVQYPDATVEVSR